MSVIIKGMDMPNECSECLFSCCDISVGAPARCIILGKHSARYSRLKNCPLVEIPTPHGRLIDADANVGSYVETWTCTCSEFGTQRVMAVDDLKNLPAIIEAEGNDEK